MQHSREAKHLKSASQHYCLCFVIKLSVATIKHVMDKVRDTVAFLNPGQTPVIGADQPLYALAEQIKWQWPEKYGEDKFVLMFGGLHTEMAAFSSIGNLLKGSGWTSVLTDAGVASYGTAESFLKASSVTRTRLAHQVTAASLYRLMKTAYTDYCNEAIENSNEVINFEDWCERRKLQSPQFQFWYLILSMELTILLLIRSFREANFALYCDALSELIPYFFANNNINYARWLPIHLRDMMSLEQHHLPASFAVAILWYTNLVGNFQHLPLTKRTNKPML